MIHYDREALTPERLWRGLCEQRLVSGPSPISADCPITRANLHPAAGASIGDRLVDAFLGVVIDKVVARSAAAVIDALRLSHHRRFPMSRATGRRSRSSATVWRGCGMPLLRRRSELPDWG
jgi:hypothetical protein